MDKKTHQYYRTLIIVLLIIDTFNCSWAMNFEDGEIDKTKSEPAIEETTDDYWTGSGSGPEESDSNSTETKEALAHEASDQDTVVYVGEGTQYLPVPALKSRTPINTNLQTRHNLHELQSLGVGVSGSGSSGGGVIGSGTTSADANEDDEWDRHPETWDREHRRYRPNTTRVRHIEAECQDDYMKIRIDFNGSFTGLLYSAGYSYDSDCMYVNGTGRQYYEFYIQLNRCGTLGENTHHQDSRINPTKNLMWNTITVQYNPLIEEEFDEHFKVTCEYGYDFWKTVTFPFLDVEVATGNPVVFTLQPPECFMEIKNGYDPKGTVVSGPVRVGDALTLIIHMRSKYEGFDIVINDCYAHNGGKKRIQLIDEYGCPVDDKLISKFRGSWSESGLFETQVYAYMKAFRFTGSPALYIECDVRMCHGRCPGQPCHWRNVKNVAKRSLAIGGPAIPATSLSENLNLFQSLRVLQEGEAEPDIFQNSTVAQNGENSSGNKVCLRSTIVSTIVGLGCSLICMMVGILLILCSRIRRATRDKLLSDSLTYMTHKGRIN
ncbi:hypothetical protein PV328_005022 [Microctonus aethiopoides]|uniref:ZP domain-containing protein n=1 Tax=Microctonus aethiopoides TaxID=144406 RepID=A0AA39FL28_9HYME|nr:hypothetical protein PV328_005022 [Microctonus aethiopoides]